MFRDPLHLLQNEARTKPHIADLVARAIDLTDEEIDSLPILLWIRTALKLLRANQRAMQTIDEGTCHNIEGAQAHIGKLVRYEGESFFHAAPLPFEVKSGELIFVTGAGVWLGEKLIRRPDPRFQQGQLLGEMTRKEYIEEKNQRLLIDHGMLSSPPTLGSIDLQNSNGYNKERVITTAGMKVHLRKF